MSIIEYYMSIYCILNISDKINNSYIFLYCDIHLQLQHCLFLVLTLLSLLNLEVV